MGISKNHCLSFRDISNSITVCEIGIFFHWPGGQWPLKGGYHDDAAENGYVVTSRHSREIRDVTNQYVPIRSESAKHPSRRTVVKLTAAYVMLVTRS